LTIAYGRLPLDEALWMTIKRPKGVRRWIASRDTLFVGKDKHSYGLRWKGDGGPNGCDNAAPKSSSHSSGSPAPKTRNFDMCLSTSFVMYVLFDAPILSA
jgi:hypothetical protein